MRFANPSTMVCFSRSTPKFWLKQKKTLVEGVKILLKPIRIAEKYYMLGGGFKDCLFFTPTWGNESNLTNMFQIRRNHQRDTLPAIRRKNIAAYQLLTRWFRLRFRASAPWWPTAPWRRQRRRQHYHHQSSPAITLTPV